MSKNEKLFNYDAGKEAQVRSVQSHDKFVERAGVSSRVALNLTGIELNDLKKGQLLSKKGFFRGFREIDAIVFARELTHGQSVKGFDGLGVSDLVIGGGFDADLAQMAGGLHAGLREMAAQRDRKSVV